MKNNIITNEEDVRRRNQGFSSGQLSETVSFVLLVTVILFMIIIMRIVILSDSVQALRITVDRNENERLKSGVNALFLMSDERYEMSLLDLAGRAASERKELVFISDVLYPVNVSEELEWRMDVLFGKGNWHMTIPFLEKKEEEFITQMVLVADVSGSLCDDLNDLKRLPPIIENINKEGRTVEATLYLLGRSECSSRGYDEIVCSDFETEHFKCRPLKSSSDRDRQDDDKDDENDDEEFYYDIAGREDDDQEKPSNVCKLTGETTEDWGNGIACAARWGPVGGWAESEKSIRLGVVISDELSGGSECGCKQWESYECTIDGKIYTCRDCVEDDACVSCDIGTNTLQDKSVNNGITEALDNDVKVFGLLANPCGNITAPGSGNEFVCNCKGVLANYMGYISSITGGESFALVNASQVSDIIEDIIIKTKKDDMDKIDIGSLIPSHVRIYAYEILVPTTGNYTKATAYAW